MDLQPALPTRGGLHEPLLMDHHRKHFIDWNLPEQWGTGDHDV